MAARQTGSPHQGAHLLGRGMFHHAFLGDDGVHQGGGVMSKTGLRAAQPGGARRPPPQNRSSSGSRCSMGMSAPDLRLMSMVEVGAATMTRDPMVPGQMASP